MKKEKSSKKCKCPYCDSELRIGCFEPMFCKPCNIEFTVCKSCGGLYNKESVSCPKCKSKNDSVGESFERRKL